MAKSRPIHPRRNTLKRCVPIPALHGQARQEPLLDEFCELTRHERKYATKLLAGGGAVRRGQGRPFAGRETADLRHRRWRACSTRSGSTPSSPAASVSNRCSWRGCRSTRGAMEHSRWSSAMECSPSAPRRSTGSSRRGKLVQGGQPANTETQRGDQGACSLCGAECWTRGSPVGARPTPSPTVAATWAGASSGASRSLTSSAVGRRSARPGTEASMGLRRLRRDRGGASLRPSRVDTDNGGEFLNRHLHRVLPGSGEASGDDPFAALHKNDQAHVEQKNSTHVRQLLGFERLGHDLAVPWSRAVGGLEHLAQRLHDDLQADRKKACREQDATPAREGAQEPLRRSSNTGKPPATRRRPAALRDWRDLHDPFELKDWIEGRLARIWKLDAALNHAQSEGETDLAGVAAPFLRGPPPLRSEGPAKTETRPDVLSPKPSIKPPTQKNATETPKAA